MIRFCTDSRELCLLVSSDEVGKRVTSGGKVGEDGEQEEGGRKRVESP
jgi:hypothetical protein